MDRSPQPVEWAAATAAAFVAALGIVGADALWLVPLGARIAHGELPSSIPFATAPTAGWHDVPAGGEVVFWAFYHAFGGDRGLVLAQAVAVAVGFAALVRGLRRESSHGSVLLLAALVLAGSLPAVVVTNVSLFSLALFPVLLALLEAETRAPSQRLWWAVPLLALWGNLHGAVLAGFGLLACYLVLDRARREPRLAAAVLAASTLALLANAALWHTPAYYRSVFDSAPARRGAGLWAPLSTSTFDLALVAAAAVLLILSVAGRVHIRLWEAAALAGLVVVTVHVSRTGTFLLFLAAYPAARSLRLPDPRPRLLAAAAIVLGAGATALLANGPLDPGSAALARRAAQTGRPVLAEAVLGQQVALAGGRVWVDNPIDAFRSVDQSLYLDWLAGRPAGAAAVEHAAYVLVGSGSVPGRVAARDRRLVRVTSGGGAVLYRVRARP